MLHYTCILSSAPRSAVQSLSNGGYRFYLEKSYSCSVPNSQSHQLLLLSSALFWKLKWTFSIIKQLKETLINGFLFSLQSSLSFALFLHPHLINQWREAASRALVGFSFFSFSFHFFSFKSLFHITLVTAIVSFFHPFLLVSSYNNTLFLSSRAGIELKAKGFYCWLY